MTPDAMTDSAPASTPVACPACGAAASGRFCPHCGASLLPRACPRCATAVRATAKFCHRCGASVTGEADVPGPMVGATNRTPWLVLGILLIAVISAITWTGINKNNPPAAPIMPNAGNADGSAGAPFAGGGGAAQGAGGTGNVDIASMSPEERFNRLFDRVMRSMAAGDTAAAQQFAPMAVMAYGMLPQHNADLRLHVALVQLAAGNVPAARAVADTILAQSPDHLFGYIVRAEAARAAGDAAGERQAKADFGAKVTAETARADRPEYAEHQALIDEYRKP
jgi:hypothetical protein